MSCYMSLIFPNKKGLVCVCVREPDCFLLPDRLWYSSSGCIINEGEGWIGTFWELSQGVISPHLSLYSWVLGLSLCELLAGIKLFPFLTLNDVSGSLYGWNFSLAHHTICLSKKELCSSTFQCQIGMPVYYQSGSVNSSSDLIILSIYIALSIFKALCQLQVIPSAPLRAMGVRILIPGKEL